MSHQGKLITFLFVLICFISCNKHQDTSYTTHQYQKTSIQNTGIDNYQHILRLLNDTMVNWKNHNIWGRNVNCEYASNIVDSLLCFNKAKNKFITCVLESECKEDKGDGIHFLYGVKIHDGWYFFRGAYIFLPREMYQKDIHMPFSFAKLHEIAMKEVFSGYLVKKKTKKDMGWWKNIFAPEYNYSYEINERFFDQIGTIKDYVFTRQDSLRMTPALLDSIMVLQAYRNWLPAGKQNIGATTPSSWKYFYKTPYPLSLPWEKH